MKTAKTGKNALLTFILTLMLLLSTVSSVMFLMDKFGSGEDGEFGPTREDGVVIADEYTIESTLPISDAYKSGDTDKLDDRRSSTPRRRSSTKSSPTA